MRVLVICAWSMGLMLLGSVCRVSAQAPELRGNAFRVRKVLVLHSYHSDTQWTRDITAGITAGLEGADVPVDLHVEYMDTKRYYNEEYLAKLKAVYKYKFSEAPADVLITVDDNALRFAVDSRSDVFSGVPIVFCGVNHYDPGEFAEQRNLTGIVESWDALGTVRLALHLHPGTTTLYVINDDTPTGRANRARLDESFASPDARVDVQYLGSGVTMQQLQQQVAQLPENSVVLMMSFNRDSEGVYYDYETSIEFVRKVCERPMYGVWDFYLGHGIVGGHLTSGETQGRLAARLTERILTGAFPSLISVIRDVPNRYMFDHDELRRFGVPAEALPENSVIIHMPEGFFSKNRPLILATTIVLLSVGLFVFLLTFNILRRKTVENKLRRYQQQLAELVERRTVSLAHANRKLEDEINRRHEAEERLQKTLEELRESNQDLERFAYIASHDLREPLRTITGFADLLRRRYNDRLDGDAQEFMGLMTDAADRAATLIKDLLEYSRVGTRSREFCPTDVNAVVDDIIANLHYMIEESNATVHRDSLPTINGDPTQLGQLFQNLIQNAVKFRKEDTPLTIDILVEDGDDEWTFTVADNGIGIAPEQFDRVFQIFQRLHGPEYSGTGMGLAICRRIVERHGGHIWVDSEPGEGTAFRFTLPVMDGHDTGDRRADDVGPTGTQRARETQEL